MRDLGTPSYGRPLFREIMARFPNQAEFCVVRVGGQAVAAALLMHGDGITEVPSASALRRSNDMCANMYLYWNLLERSVDRCQGTFDFGRSSVDSNTYRFKKQWGAMPADAVWQYHLRRGGIKDARPDNPRYRRLVRLWRRLPLWVARRLGPPIVKGIP
jgi:FemAB-related protein (PEP-CTERM system-associated)